VPISPTVARWLSAVLLRYNIVTTRKSGVRKRPGRARRGEAVVHYGRRSGSQIVSERRGYGNFQKQKTSARVVFKFKTIGYVRTARNELRR